MKSNIMKRINGERYYLSCDCMSSDCMIAFSFCPEDITNNDTDSFGNGVCDIYFVKKWIPSFWHRIKTAFKYIFFKENIVYQDIALPLESYKEFREVADAMERCYNKTCKSNAHAKKGCCSIVFGNGVKIDM